MSVLRHSGPRALQQVQRHTLRRPQHRLASESHAPKPHDPTPATESFGSSFYIVLAAIPTAVILYQYAYKADASNPIANFINKYSTKQDTWREMNALHTRMVERAGQDRNLFANSPRPNVIELNMPENLQRASQINVRAGWGTANLDEVIAHYRDKAFKEEEEKLQKMKEGKLPGQPNYVEPDVERGY